MKIKQKVIGALGFANYRRMLVGGLRVACFYHKRDVLNPAVPEGRVLRDPARDRWFGYYDVPATSPDGRLQLSLVVEGEGSPASLRVCAADGSGEREVARTSAWNWQMGCRAQWLRDGTVLFNDFDGEGYVSRRVTTIGNEVMRYPFPVYTLSADERLAFYPDFTILGRLRPGYGYTNLDVDFADHYAASPNGVWCGDLRDSTSKLMLSMGQIEAIDPPGPKADGSSYVNHIAACPFAERLMFFHLWKDPNGLLRNHVVVTDFEGRPVSVLSNFTRASHYAWKDARHLLLTVVCGNACTYRLYDVETGRYEEFPHLSTDGHPSYVNAEQGLFVTDTYPDHLGMQHVMLCNERGVVAELATVYHNPCMVEERRCDCHPRYSAGILSFDAVERAHREQHVLRLPLDAEAVAAYEDASEEESDLVRIYKQLCNTREVLWPKLLLSRLTNTALNAHLCLWRMTHGKGGKLGVLRRHAQLQERYGCWVSPQTRIGKRFRMMHALGICLGSGSVIGDDCILYQQVTVGKGSDGFAKLGDGVTVYAGAKVVGAVSVGDHATVGANAVVTRDVPPGATVVGANRIVSSASGKTHTGGAPS